MRSLFVIASLIPSIVSAENFPVHAYGGEEELEQLIEDSERDSKAMFELGTLYDEGVVVERDFDKALELFIRASRAGNSDAQVKLGKLYLQLGEKSTSASERALEEFRRAAESGHSEAAYWVGMMLSGDFGVSENPLESQKFMFQSAESGYAPAQSSLGESFLKGEGVPQNFAEANKWFQAAASQGDRVAQFFLAYNYHLGQGIEIDHVKAVKLAELSAKQGFPDAQALLGLLYEDGKGIQRDYTLAYMWLNISAANGNTSAIQYRDRILRDMLPNKVEQAQEMSRECLNSDYQVGCFYPPFVQQ